MSKPLLIRPLGRQPYEPVWRAMQAFTDARGPETADELWVVEHEPVFTLGQAGRWEHVLVPGEIPVVPVDRGEQAIIDTLLHWNIVAVRRDGAPGVYVADAKVAALGLRVRRGCTFHGLAFNVNMDLEPFHRINPCGYQGLAVTQVLDLGGPGSLAAVEAVLIGELARQF